MGKGGGGGNELTDTIQTDSSVKLIDALCEGTIKGLVNGAKSIYLDKTPIQNSDGSYNFAQTSTYTPSPTTVPNTAKTAKGVGQVGTIPNTLSWATTPGSNTQDCIPGFEAVQSEFAVGQEVNALTGAVTIGITTPDLDAVIVTIIVPRLISYDNEGNSNVANVPFKIYLKTGNGLFVLQHTVSISEKSSNGFEIQRTITIPSGTTSIQLRVERTGADSTSDKYVNAFAWKSYTEVMYDKYNYPNTALIAMELNSKILKGSVKERHYLSDCQEIKIPTNATVQADGSLTYSGSWNGSFTTPTWCADPAWCLYDLLNNSRYGADVPEVVLNRTKWDYYSASIWCNELVSDGQGSQETRFLLNVIIDQPLKAYDLIAQLAGVFGGIFFLLGGGLSLATDRQLTPVSILTNDNSSFNYQNSALRNRHTVALVNWQNPDLLGDNDLEVVEDPTGIALYKYREIKVTAIGCNRRSQARRFGLWYLLTARLQANTLVAKTDILAARLKPGDVVEVADRNKSPFLIGRFSTTSTTALTLDQNITLNPAQSWVIRYTLPNGQPETRLIQPTAGLTLQTISTTPSPSAIPLPESIWVIQAQTALAPPQYQVLASIPKESQDWELTLVKYEPTKWEQISNQLHVNTPPASNIPTIPNKPRNLVAYPLATSTSDQLSISWDYPILVSGLPDPYTQSYLVSYRSSTNNTFTTIQTTDRSVEINNLPAAFYWIKVIAIDNQNHQSFDISTTDAIPVGVLINASTQWSIVNSAVFIPLFI